MRNYKNRLAKLLEWQKQATDEELDKIVLVERNHSVVVKDGRAYRSDTEPPTPMTYDEFLEVNHRFLNDGRGSKYGMYKYGAWLQTEVAKLHSALKNLKSVNKVAGLE